MIATTCGGVQVHSTPGRERPVQHTCSGWRGQRMIRWRLRMNVTMTVSGAMNCASPLEEQEGGKIGERVLQAQTANNTEEWEHDSAGDGVLP